MPINGFSVNLGQPARGADLKSMVRQEHLTQLLQKAKDSPAFAQAKGSYEFRLRLHNNQAVLELRQKSTGFLASIFGKQRRSDERAAAYEAIRQHLTALPPRSEAAGGLRIDTARALATQVMDLHDLAHTDVPQRALYGIFPTPNEVRGCLMRVMDDGRKAATGSSSLYPGLRVQQETMTFLDRASVSIDDVGRLRIKSSNQQAGNGETNLKTIHEYFSRSFTTPLADGSDPTPVTIQKLVSGFLLHVGPGAGKAAGHLLGDAMHKQLGVTALTQTPDDLEFAVCASLNSEVSVNVIQSGPIDLGPPGAPVRTLPYAAKLEFRMPSHTLADDPGATDPEALYRDVAFHLAPELGELANSRDDDIDNLRRQAIDDFQKGAQARAWQRQAEEANRHIPRGPQKLQPDVT